MTLKEFQRLPLMLTPAQVRQIVGCNDATLRALRETNKELGVLLPGMKHYRYRKQAVAKLVCVQVD